MQKRIFTNAQVFPYALNNQPVDTVVIEEGRISAVGYANDLIPKTKARVKIVDLKKSFLFPSFTDSHIHLLTYGLSLQRVDVMDSPSKKVCLEKVAARVQKTKPGSWIIGHGWNHNIWSDGYGSKADLDNLSTKHPIYLSNKSLHSGWANSAALQEAGIDRNKPDPPNGTIKRDESGEPTGILLEGAMNMVESVIPEPDSNERELAILNAQKILHQFGITAVHDFDPWVVFETLKDLHQSRRLTLRVTKGIPEPFLVEAIEKNLKSGEGDDWLKIGWLKLFSDGALGPQTASMISPYEHSRSTGMLFLNKEDVIDYGEKALPNGISLAVHAIGDRANQEILLAYSELHKKGLLQMPALSSRIEHVQLIQEEHMKLFSAVGAAASMQPIHATSDMEMAEEYWGIRCRNSYAWNSLLKSGAQLVFGSDAPVESPNPFYGLHSAVTRRKLNRLSKGTQGWIPKQRISLQESLQAYTQTPPVIGGFGHMLGKIKPGFTADFVFLQGDFFKLPDDDIQFVSPLATMIGGKWGYINDNIKINIS